VRIARERKRVAFDRLLARLIAVAPGRWILKGGFALDLRLIREPPLSARRWCGDPEAADRRLPPVRRHWPRRGGRCLPLELQAAEKIHAYTRT